LIQFCEKFSTERNTFETVRFGLVELAHQSAPTSFLSIKILKLNKDLRADRELARKVLIQEWTGDSGRRAFQLQ
jgi:hypothetical protein